jgi:hypothetical protein
MYLFNKIYFYISILPQVLWHGGSTVYLDIIQLMMIHTISRSLKEKKSFLA